MTITDRTTQQNGQPFSGMPEGLDPARISGHYAWVHSVARNLVRDPWSAEDVTQETLMAALAAPPSDVPTEQRMRAWLGRVAFNLSRLRARQGARQRAREVRVARKESLPSVCEELEAAGTLEALAKAIAELSASHREVVELRYFSELSTAEIAARTGSNELSVRKRLWRARNKLRASLDHDPKTGRLLAALLPWTLGERGLRLKGLGGLAAGLTLCLGAVWRVTEQAGDSGRASIRLPAGTLVGAQDPIDRSTSLSPRLDDPTGPSERPGRRPIPTAPGMRVQPPGTGEGLPPSEVRFAGVVIDLDGRPQPGLELVDPEAPNEILATSDLSGRFHVAGRAAGRSVLARGSGWATLVEARFERGLRGELQPVVVAPASDLVGCVLDEAGRSISGVRLALRCEERTWSRLGWPVRLDSAVLGEFEADVEGHCFLGNLPRDSGLVLSLLAPGHEPFEIETSWLGDEETFVLRALDLPQALAGTVFRRDGRPAGGALVHLGMGRAIADSEGRFELPLLGIGPDSCLVANDPQHAAEPAVLFGFGKQLWDGEVTEVELELGEEYDPVEGRLSGPGAAGWSVAVYPKEGAALDVEGIEQPLRLTSSDEEGSFGFLLPRGSYDLYAVDPNAPRAIRLEGLRTGGADWVVALPPPELLMPFSASLQSADEPLAEALVTIALRLDGLDGTRRMNWRQEASDQRGVFAFQAGPIPELELLVTHAFLGTEPRALRLEAGCGQAFVLDLPRPAFLGVSGASDDVTNGTLLDSEGRSLSVQGPLHSARGFDLHVGRSPIFQIPTEARWLELSSSEGEPRRVPIEPRPGEVLHVRP